MKRWHQDYRIAKREWKKHHQMHVESNKARAALRVGRDPYEVDCPCDTQIGRFRKKDAFDCGKPHCYGCHDDKYPRRVATHQEQVADVRFQEQVGEIA